ncbi:hypothetical protein ABS642_01970 [Microbacterium sp. A8/3-1]|uniref:Nuclear transport factor 2 family protein n=1 Tax=Microbacterium sp. A8/3-1 TaxID=3160749 RepID=A0AAU7VXP8_9MICO
MIHHRHALTSIIALVLTSALVMGCSPAPEPTPTPTAAFASEEEAFAAAEETYRAYIDAFNEVDLGDPNTFEPVFIFTTGDYLKLEREDLSAMHARGDIRGGTIEVIEFSPQTYKGSEVTARVCTDVGSTTFTDSEGVSLVPADRPSRVALDLTFIVAHGKTLLASAEPVEDDRCASH